MSQYEYYPRRNPSSNTLSVLGGAVISAALAGVLLWAFGVIHFSKEAPPPHNPEAKERDAAPRSERTTEEMQRIQVYKSTIPSVVNVDTMAYTVNRFDLTEEQHRQGTGSGFIWDAEGRIVTNFHVVKDSLIQNNQGEVVIHPDRKVMVTLGQTESTPARLVGIAPDFDLAVIQLTRLPIDGVKKIEMGSSSDLEVGQTVFTIGSPFGQPYTMTHGIISALHRQIQSPTQHVISDVIQTDAALNPGNSGGPLLDKDGRLIGVNTAITSPSGGNVGIGYAIPVDTVNRVVTQIIRTGRTPMPSIGADYVLQESRVRRAGIPKGVVIRRVHNGTSAAKAGLQPYDVILKINNEEVVGLADLERTINQAKAGEELTLTILRDGQVLDVRVKVEVI